MIIIKTGIYVRVSTEEQAKEGFSIRSQQEKLTDYIRVKGWELYSIYIDDGISGKNITDRPQINRLISDVLEKNIENVLVYKIDRLTRSTKDLITLMDLFNEKGCAFNSLMESIDTHTPSGRMFIKIIGIFAEFERENIIERISVGIEKKVREGYTLASYSVPYGYQREIGQREITVHDEESKIVKEIFHLYLNKHKPFTAIATDFNLRHVPSRNNARWYHSMIRYILTNPIYMGKVRFAVNDEQKYFEAEGKHEAIIEEDVFLAVQSKLAKMQRIIKKRPKEDNYFCGTLYCAVCGSKMTTHGQYKEVKGERVYYSSYICLGKKYVGCPSGTLSHRKLELAFRDYIAGYEDFTYEPELNQEFMPEGINLEEMLTQKTEYKAILAKLMQKEKDIMRLYISEKIEFAEYNQMQEIIRREKKAYELKISELENAESLTTELRPEDIIESFRENWDELTNLEKMQFLQTYIHSIYAEREENREVLVKRLEFHKS